MSRVRMLQTTKGSEDGLAVLTYRAGEVYTLGEALSKAFLDAGFAVQEMPELEVKDHAINDSSELRVPLSKPDSDHSKRPNNKRRGNT